MITSRNKLTLFFEGSLSESLLLREGKLTAKFSFFSVTGSIDNSVTDSTKASVSDSVWTVVVSEESGTRVVSVTPDSVVDSSPSFFSPNFRDLKVIKIN